MRPPLNWGLTSPVALNIPNAIVDYEPGVPHFLCEDIHIAYLQGFDSDCKLSFFRYKLRILNI